MKFGVLLERFRYDDLWKLPFKLEKDYNPYKGTKGKSFMIQTTVVDQNETNPSSGLEIQKGSTTYVSKDHLSVFTPEEQQRFERDKAIKKAKDEDIY